MQFHVHWDLNRLRENAPTPVILSAAKDLALRIFKNSARFFVACGSSE
jgi:hypothetical protein